jgi:hypothetical protein
MPLTPELAQGEVERMRKLKGQKLPELTAFDYSKVQRPIEGLFRNTCEDLLRKIKPLPLHEQQQHFLLYFLTRITQVLYSAVVFIIAEQPPDPVRKPKYAFVLPSINRQLIDLYVTLLYILDDFIPRVEQYQQSGWKDIKKHMESEIEKHGHDPVWADHLREQQEILVKTAIAYDVTPEQQSDWMHLIPWWDTPNRIKNKLEKKGRDYAENPGTAPSLTKNEVAILHVINEWWGGTSQIAHMAFSGLLQMAPFVMATDLMGEAYAPALEEHHLRLFTFEHFQRTALLALSVLTEVNLFMRLDNLDAIRSIWKTFVVSTAASPAPSESKEIYNVRYRELLGEL